MKKTQNVIWIILGTIIVIAIVIFFIFKYSKNEPQKGMVQNSNNSGSVVQPGIDPNQNANVSDDSSQVITYTSRALGVQFDYLKDGGWGKDFEVVPAETENTITLNDLINGKADPIQDNSLSVYDQTSGESVEQTLRRADAKDFQNENCTVVPYPANSTTSYLIWDKRIPTSYFRATTLDGSPYQNDQNPCLGEFEFYTDPSFPGVIYTVTYLTQAESFFADSAHTKFWYQTVRLITK